MSNLVFPLTLPGWDINVNRIPVFATKIQTAASGKELRAAWWASPRYKYGVTLNFVRQFGFSAQALTDEASVISAFHATHRGAWDSFLFPDPYEVNLCPNGNSEMGAAATGLNPEGNKIAVDVGNGAAHSGTWLRAFLNYTGSTIAGYQWAAVSKILPCVPGEWVYMETWCRNLAGSMGAGLGMLNFSWRNAAGGEISASITGWTPVNTYTKYSAAYQAPAGAVAVQLNIGVQNQPTGQEVFFDDIIAKRMASSTDVPDGTNLVADGANGQWLRRVRFEGDEMELQRIANLAWAGNGTINLISVK